MPETHNRDSYSNSSTQGSGTPEIVRKRRNNVNRNNAKWNAIGLPAVKGGGAASGGAATSNGCRSLLSTVAGPGATRNGDAGEKRGGGGVHGYDNRVGDALVPLAGLEERWPGRKQEISELAGLIGESTDGVPVPPLLVTGPPCTGKTSVVRAVLDHRGCSYAYVNCAEVVQRRDLLEALVEQVAGGSRDDILAANRVDRTFGDASTENGPSSSSSSSSSSATATATAAPVAEEEATLGTAETSREQDLVLDAEARGQQGAGQGSRQHQQHQQQHQRKGRGRGPRCSSWNVFFRQLAALLARRSQALLNKSPATPAAAAGGCSGGGGGGDTTACGSVCGDVSINAGGGGGGGGGSSAGDASAGPPPPEFAPKLFVVLDNAEALLSETVAGVGVGAGGAGGAGNQWRGQDVLTKLASLQGMVDSLTGFAGEEATQTATGGGGGGGDQDPHSNASNISAAHRPSQSTPFGRHHHHHHQQEQGQPPLPPICPILISQNGFFASEIMGGRGGGGDWRGAGGRNRSLVMNAYPVQLRFPPYSKEHLPSVLASTAHMFGLDLNVNLRDGGGGGGESSEGGGESGRKRRVRGNDEGRKLFRKMATALVTTLQNETRDAWELGAEAARIWPAYKRSAEDGCYDAHLAAALKPLLTETTKRLHGFGRQDDDKRQNQNKNGNDKRGRNDDAKKEGRAKPNGLGLSRSGKHLLVSAYLASHNSRDTDRDMFTAKSTKRSKRPRSTRSSAGNAENLVEAGVQDLPEAREFQLERLLSIMSSIVAVTEAGTKAANSMGSTELFAQIKSLTKLNLMRDCGQRKSFDLDCPSYRCNISRELAEAVAKEIGLDLSQYLVMA